MQTIDEVQQEIIDEFSIYDDWMDKYAVIIEYGNKLRRLMRNIRRLRISFRVARVASGCKRIIGMENSGFRLKVMQSS